MVLYSFALGIRCMYVVVCDVTFICLLVLGGLTCGYLLLVVLIVCVVVKCYVLCGFVLGRC